MQRYDLESVSCNRGKSVICRIGKYLFFGDCGVAGLFYKVMSAEEWTHGYLKVSIL